MSSPTPSRRTPLPSPLYLLRLLLLGGLLAYGGRAAAAVSWSLPYYEPPTTTSGAFYDVGPGQTYLELADVPWLSLAAGDTVRIHYRSTPYAAIIALKTQATQAAPLRIYGVRDPSTGAVPVVSASGAVANAAVVAHLNGLGVLGQAIMVIVDGGGRMPSWIEVANLELRDCRSTSTYTTPTGSGTFGGFPCAVWSRAKHLAFKGCRVANNGLGIFTQCNLGIAGDSEDTLIEGCDFDGNGNINHSTEHNIYTQGVSSTIQFCRVNGLIHGAPGSSIKDRSAGTIIRYNYIVAAARAIDLVEPEGDADSGIDQVLALPSYGDDYVYGNIIVNKVVPDGSVNPIHYGADNNPGHARKRTLHFYHNTFSIEAGYNPDDKANSAWRVNLFQITDAAGRVEAYNNIFSQLKPTDPAWGGCALNVLAGSAGDVPGTVDFRGGNWIRNGWTTAYEDWPTPATGNHVVQTVPLVTGDDPLFVDRLTDPTLVATSPCRNLAVALPASLTSTYPVLFQCGAPPVARTTFHDAGGFEGPAVPGIAVSRGGSAVAATDAIASSAPGVAVTLSYVIADAGGDVLTLGSVGAITGTNCTVTVTTAPAATVAVSATTSLGLSVTPTAAGTWSFPVSFTTNVTGHSPTAWTVSGTAIVPAPGIAVTRGSATIAQGGSDAVGGTVAGGTTSLTYVIANPGNASLSVGATGTITGTNCTVAVTSAASSAVAAAAATSLVLSVTPTAAGAWSFPVSFTTNVTGRNPAAWTVSGTAAMAGGGSGDGGGNAGGGGGCGTGSVAILLLPLVGLVRRRRR